MDPSTTLVEELRRHALIVGEVTLTSGRTAQYYVDAKRAILRPTGFRALAELVAGHAARLGATAVGGLTMGADAPACAALAGGADVKAFFVRKETKAHGLQRRIEGPDLEPGERCLIVEDVVTTGGSTVQAIEAVREAGTRSAASSRSSTALRAARRRSPRRPAARPTCRSRRSTTCIRTGRTALDVNGGWVGVGSAPTRRVVFEPHRQRRLAAAGVRTLLYPAAVDVRACLTRVPAEESRRAPPRAAGADARLCAARDARRRRVGADARGRRARRRPAVGARRRARRRDRRAPPARCRRGCACPPRRSRPRRAACSPHSSPGSSRGCSRPRTGTSSPPGSAAGSRR